MSSSCRSWGNTDSSRVTNTGELHPEELFLSPASGKVLRLGAGGRTVTIFMHLHNVHLTTSPLDGVVKRIIPERGIFKPAFVRSADSNTKNTIVLDTAHGEICVVQIAGFFTRKIICEVKVGQSVKKGERLGKICFGSRVDVTIPDGFDLLVKPGSRVKYRKTPIALKR
jgi:phosphatidylserine decarboxylase